MELDPRVKRSFARLLPQAILDRLDRAEALIHQHVTSFAARIPAGAVVLDAGCGESRFRHLFPHLRLVGYDRCIGDARWDYAAVDVVGDLHQLPFASACLDGVLCIVTLEHVPDPAAVLNELHRVLKPGASMCLVVPLLWEVHQAPHDYFRFTRHGMEHLVSRGGFAMESLVPLGGFFTLLGRRCVNCLGFFQQSWRWVLFLLLAPWLGFLLPLCLPWLDVLDRDRSFTLGYALRLRKE
ncbi:MAG: class I SAM-dependent methyltransferase [Acidobacteria bacterium]|nr:class I SAM-dependent methyltransferase [Acidobacteriota bacterium]